MNVTSDTEKLHLQVDREHNALRLATVLLFIFVGVLTFFITNALITSEGLNLLAAIIAFAVAAIVTRVSEPTLKRMWPSKRFLELDSEGARLMNETTVQSAILAEATANTYYWCFKIPRRGRMPKGWYVIACALQQDDTFIATYAFASPENMERLKELKEFVELKGEDKKAKTAKADSLRLAGEQRRLRVAEEHRWHDGAELTVPDFEALIKRLNGLYVRWNT
ncbi:MAG: hypothetical protein LCI00_05210 [Chloroflexi bacterium]|nr:hypothetical protein [Chloroflexota bacterium]MCC6896451.1 hypothetical protein [Anaerolineae bacterium]